MKVFRIAKRQFIHDLSGEGARLFGGRWNRKGVSVLYTSESRSLATVEYLVHIPMNILPNDLAIAEFEIPDPQHIETLDPATLPTNWSAFPSSIELAEIGSTWIQKGESLALCVPSSVVKGELNVLLNPAHHEFSKVRIISVEDYCFDRRLRKG